jgi:hypothetical protein
MRTGSNWRFALRASCGTLAILAAACAGEATGDVRGVVKLDGQPLPNARVTFLSEAGNKSCFSISASDGGYGILKCPVGPAAITVQSLPPRPKGLARGQKAATNGMEKLEKRMAQAKKGWTPKAATEEKYVPIPDRYKDSGRSGLSYTVNPGSQQHNIELTAK